MSLNLNAKDKISLSVGTNLMISALSASIAEIITLPICTIKTNYQNTNSSSIVSTTKNIYNSKSIRGFYNSSVPAVCGQAFSTSSKYTLYRYFESIEGEYSKKYYVKILNGLAAGITSSLITHPIDTMKVSLQMGNSFSSYMSEFRQLGAKLIYRGYSKTFIKVLSSAAFFLPIYDIIRSKQYNPFVSAFLSAVISTTIMHPVDYLKTRHIANLPLFHGYNPITYYKGYSLNLARIVPHFILMMYFIDRFERLVLKHNNE